MCDGSLWTPVPDSDKRNPHEYSLTFNFVTSEHLARARAGEMLVDVYVDASASSNHGASQSRFSVTPVVDVIAEFDRPISADELRQAHVDIGLLWSLLTGTRSEVIGGLVAEQARSPELPLADRDEDGFSAALLGACANDAEDRDCFGDLLYDLTRGEARGQLGAVLETWLMRRDSLRIASQLLVDTWTINVGWESRLGLVAQALEAYHRVSSSVQTFISTDEYATVEAALAAQIPALTNDVDLRRALKKRLEFGNQVSLRRRTQDLVKVLPLALRNQYGTRWREGVEFMTLTRNAVIHRDPTNPLPSYRDLVRVTGLFCVAIHVALLRAVGVPDDPIVQRLLVQRFYQDSLARTQ